MGPNPIWEYFQKNEAKAICKICRKSLSLGSSIPKKQTITNIKNHLAKIHKNEWKKYCEASAKYQSLNKFKKSEARDTVVKKEIKQSTLQDVIERKTAPLWPDDHPISLRIDKCIMDLIIVNMLPYSLVQGEAFRRLNFADPQAPSRYRQKSEKYFRTSLMPATYERVKAKVVLLLEKAEWISFTTDIWSNPAKTCSLLSFTAHFIVGSKREKVILAASVMEEDHTGQYIAQKLTETVAQYNILNKIHMGIRDNASNMNAAMRYGNFVSIGCVAHTLQLVIHDVIFKDTSVMAIVKKCRKIVGHFKKSEQASRYLNKFQETCDLPKHALIQDVETRWNSTYLMLERLVEQKSAINLYMAERGGIEVPTAEEWRQISNFIIVLKCFYQATIDISSDSSTVSLIVPFIAMLNSKLAQKDQDSEDIKLLKSRLCESVNRRFSYARNTLELSIATLIDPRFKTKYLINDEAENAKTEMLKFLHQNCVQTNNMDVDAEELGPSCSTPDFTPGNNSPNDDLWDTHDKMPLTVTELGDSDNCQVPFEEHLTCYLKEPLLLRNADIFQYWTSSPYIYLRPITTKYLSAPPTSVPSEQLLSAAGQIYDDRRGNLHGENVDRLLFLAYNIRLFDFDY